MCLVKVETHRVLKKKAQWSVCRRLFFSNFAFKDQPEGSGSSPGGQLFSPLIQTPEKTLVPMDGPLQRMATACGLVENRIGTLYSKKLFFFSFFSFLSDLPLQDNKNVSAYIEEGAYILFVYLQRVYKKLYKEKL